MDFPRLHIQEELPGGLDELLVHRDAALWIGNHSGEASDPTTKTLRDFIALPWNAILVESSTPTLAGILTGEQGPRANGVSGYRIPAAGPVTDISFPSRAVPVLFLNGREDGDSAMERPDGGGTNRRLLRRLGMFDELAKRTVRTLVLVPSSADNIDEQLRDMVCDLNTHVVAVVPSNSPHRRVFDEWSKMRPGPISVTLCTGPFASLTESLVDRVRSRTAADRLNLRLLFRPDSDREVLDCTDYVPTDSPIPSSFSLLTESSLASLSDDSLSENEIDGFFARTASEALPEFWRPFAAGLPWPRDNGQAIERLVETLELAREATPRGVLVATVDSEPGAGGTTAARMLAFEAARRGFPTLVARTGVAAPPADEVSAFCHSIAVAIRDTTAPPPAEHSEDRDLEPIGLEVSVPWLIVLDAEHWSGRDELVPAYVRTLTRFAHRAVIMLVRDTSAGDPPMATRRLFGDPLAHALSQSEVESLGTHINRYLAHIGHDQSISHWRQFWVENSLPIEPGTLGVAESSASFWVALEFWLRRQMSLGQSIRTWLFDRFTNARYREDVLSSTTKQALLTIAALSLERTYLPEALLPEAEEGDDPLSAQLAALALQVPAIGLVRKRTERQAAWGVSHIPLAQHLLDAVADETGLLDELGLTKAENSVKLRIELLATLAKNPALGQQRYRDLALRFAQSIFKLDRAGNQEFTRYWREVLNGLFGMSDVLWDTSRMFIHHVAISRRRVASDPDLFPDKTEAERLRLLEEAVGDLEFALSLEKGEDDERDLNILNSLARACQDLAAYLRQRGGSEERIARLDEREIQCLQQAEVLNPTNAHVLETSARGYILAASRDVQSAPQNLCSALQRIRIARGLDSAADRRRRLDELTERALSGLQALSAKDLEQIRVDSVSLAAVVTAWRLLRRVSGSGAAVLAESPGADVEAAIQTLEAVPPAKREWTLTRLLYDLTALQHPREFQRQVQLLRALEGTQAMHLQMRLELAILLHQVGSHPSGEQEFRDIRRALHDSEVIIDVPRRLAWFVQADSGDRIVCDGKVVLQPGNWRRHAMRVLQLGNTVIGFDPLDFGVGKMPPGRVLKCIVGFNVRGPYARPVPGA